MKRVFSSLSLFVMLLALAQMTPAQTSVRESRITITSDTPILGFKTSSKGEQFSVVILSPVGPSTESDLAAGGSTDLQVSQEGGNVVVSFRLLNGAVAKVVHNSNRVAIIIGFADQARALVSSQPSSALDGQLQSNGAQPGGTNGGAAPPEEASASAPPPSANVTNGSANSGSTASSGSLPSTAPPPAPQAPADAPNENLRSSGM